MRPPSIVSYAFRLPVPRPMAFDLLSEPLYLDRLTPDWFRLVPRVAPCRPLRPGSEITYRLRWHGLPFAWTSRITDWREPAFLAYEQRRGPFRYFRHEHSFHDVGGGTEIHDRVLFRMAGGRSVERLVAAPDLRRIFACRARRALPLLRALQAGAGSEARTSRAPWTSAPSSAIERPT